MRGSPCGGRARRGVWWVCITFPVSRALQTDRREVSRTGRFSAPAALVGSCLLCIQLLLYCIVNNSVSFSAVHHAQHAHTVEPRVRGRTAVAGATRSRLRPLHLRPPPCGGVALLHVCITRGSAGLDQRFGRARLHVRSPVTRVHVPVQRCLHTSRVGLIVRSGVNFVNRG